jgi:aryl-phospho-beta-D-glucosidase BglC (GH1 family)
LVSGSLKILNEKITENYIKFVKQSGFNAIRIPCAWYQHMDHTSTAHINTDWLNRVKQVVQYCTSNDIIDALLQGATGL